MRKLKALNIGKIIDKPYNQGLNSFVSDEVFESVAKKIYAVQHVNDRLQIYHSIQEIYSPRETQRYITLLTLWKLSSD